MCQEAKPIPRIIHESRGYIHHFHVNEADGKAPGFGELDFVPILKALKEVGYEGFISAEPFDYKPDPKTIAIRTYQYLQKSL